MQLSGKVTIFALVGLLLAMVPGCGSGRGHLASPGEGEAGPQARAAVPETRVDEAVRFYMEGDLAAASQALAEILAADPDHARALEYRGYLDRLIYCTVYPGDTLSEIAGYYYEDVNRWPVLARANGLGDPKRVAAYSRLRVPWSPSWEGGKDELGRLQKKAFRGMLTGKVLVIAASGGDTLEALARKHYGSERYAFFLADYNLLESRTGAPAAGTELRIPLLEGAAFSGRRGPGPDRPKGSAETDCLRAAREAMERHDYETACACLADVPRNARSRAEAEALLSRCRTEGAAYHERLGDESLRASDPDGAYRHWRIASALDPENARVKGKLQETRDLMQTLETLAGIR